MICVNGTVLFKAPLGTKFYVNNGNWRGALCGTYHERKIFVYATGETYKITLEAVKHLSIELRSVL